MSGRGILDADMQTLQSWALDGWRWWIDELIGVVPRRWRERTTSRLALLAYDPVKGRLTPMPSPDGIVASAGAPVAVVLPPALTLIRTIETPVVSQRDVANLVALDADRIMPLARDEVLLGARVRDRIAPIGIGAAHLSVEVAGLPRATAEALAQVLATRDRAPAHVLVSAPEPGQPMPIDMLPALRSAGLAGATSRSSAPLWLAVGFAFVLNIGLLVWRDSATLDTLSNVVDQQQPAVKVAQKIIARMHQEDAIVGAAIDARRRHEPLALLARIDAALPEGTWLQRFSWTGNAVQLAGFHPPKADVPGALRKAGLVVGRYGDTSNAAPTPLGEPFEISLKLDKH